MFFTLLVNQYRIVFLRLQCRGTPYIGNMLRSSCKDQAFVEWMNEAICQCKVPYPQPYGRRCLKCRQCRFSQLKYVVCNCEDVSTEKYNSDKKEFCLECGELYILPDLRARWFEWVDRYSDLKMM